MARSAPVIQQRRLRAELKRLREKAGLTQKQVADAVGWSPSKVLRIEGGGGSASTSDVMALLHYFGVSGDKADELIEITRELPTAWWDEYKSFYPPHFINFLGYEDAATRIRQFMGHTVPGLLQTERYILALFAGYMVGGEERIKRGVKVRLKRQELLTREGGPETTFIIDEAVLHRWVGGPDVVVEQLEQLKVHAAKPRVSLRIIPFSAGIHPRMLATFTIFEFPGDPEDYAVIEEDANTEQIIRDNPEISAKYLTTFSELEASASSEEESIEIIDSIIKTMQLKAGNEPRPRKR